MNVSSEGKTVLSESQKSVYNVWLKNIARLKNRPYRKRENFDDLEPDVLTAMLKLDSFFNRNPELNIEIYFQAASDYYNEKGIYPELKLFLAFGLLKIYKRFIKRRDGLSVESDEIVSDFTEGMKFIVSYLKENGKKLEDYKTLTNEAGIPLYLLHLKQQKILMYHLHFFEINPLIYGDEILNIYVDEFRRRFYDTRRQYVFSTRIKQIVEKIKAIRKTK